jgi:hypothetical protein
MRMLREPAVLEKMGMGKTSFDTKYIKSGRARWVRAGRIKRLPEHVVDQLIAEDIQASEAEREPPPPALPQSAVRKSADQRKETARQRKAPPTDKRSRDRTSMVRP